jgi:hypothetical protein
MTTGSNVVDDSYNDMHYDIGSGSDYGSCLGDGAGSGNCSFSPCFDRLSELHGVCGDGYAPAGFGCWYGTIMGGGFGY